MWRRIVAMIESAAAVNATVTLAPAKKLAATRTTTNAVHLIAPVVVVCRSLALFFHCY